MRIREAKLGDEVGIANVYVDTWRSTYQGLVDQEYLDKLNYDASIARWKKRIVEEPNSIIVAEEEKGTIVGYSFNGPNRENDPIYTGEIYAIYILEKFQRKGSGKLLVKESANRLRSLGMRSMVVWVLKGNQSYRFYKSLGAHEVGRKSFDMDGHSYEVVSYGWSDTAELIAN